jgi:cysteine synthase A
MDVCDLAGQSGRAWVNEAIRRVTADTNRSADTHLIPLVLPSHWGEWGIDVYLKDESTHPTGSLKHRLARSLFLYALCNGWIREGTTIVEASSGSTAVSEAYFARMLGLPFVAVMPRSTSKEKCELIEFQGGRCHFVDDPNALYEEARRLAADTPGGGHYMDQFTYAERATDWRGNNNIAESVFEQMAQERFPIPSWVVVGAGTGGTSATIGRYLRYQRHSTHLCVVDPENSAFFEGWRSHDPQWSTGIGSRIEGIGRPRVEPSFLPGVVDRMIHVPDAASIAAMRAVSALSGRDVGGSTGTNFWGVVKLICEMRSTATQGAIVTLICDGGDRYRNTYKSPQWLAQKSIDPAPYATALERALATGEWAS